VLKSVSAPRSLINKEGCVSVFVFVVFSFVVSIPPIFSECKELISKVRAHQWRINVGLEAVTTIPKAAQVSYTDQIAATAGTTERKGKKWSVKPVNTNPRWTIEHFEAKSRH
jgi:hypothetical protein